VHSKSLFILIKYSYIADDANVNIINEDLKYKNIKMFFSEKRRSAVNACKKCMILYLYHILTQKLT